MKKLKKLLAGVLTLAMAMSMMTMTAFATDLSDGEGTSETKAVSIDWTKTGSLTIHKKKIDSALTEEQKKLLQGTGEVKEWPEGEEPEALEGIEFTVYQIANANDLKTYYSGESDKTYSIDDYVADNTFTGTAISTYVRTTDANGEIKLTGLDLGIYVVIETNKGGSVSTPADPFLVSIPMTNSTGDGWNYNIHVYPKNEFSILDHPVKLIKYGKEVGSEDKSELANVEFYLQMQVAVKGEDGNATAATEWVTIKPSDLNGQSSEDEEEKDVFTTDVNGEIKVTGLAAGKYRFVEKQILENLVEVGEGDDKETVNKNAGYIVDQASYYEFEVVRDADTGKITEVVYTSPTGYKNVNNAGTLTETATDTDIDAKDTNVYFEVINEKPKFDKKIGEDGALGDDNGDYGVGDIIDYQIEVGVPTKIANMKTFKITDTPTNLEVVNGSVEVAGIEATEYNLSYANGGFVLTFDMNSADATIKGMGGANLTITYKAKVLESAADSTFVDPVTNNAKLTYSDKIHPEDEENPNPKEDEKVYEREDKTVSRTYSFKITKRANSTTGDLLPGVKFDLYREVPTGTKDALSDTEAKAKGLTLSPSEGKAWILVEEGMETGDGNEGTEKGIIKRGGLPYGRYCVVETQTADGYNLLEKPLELDLTVDSETTISKKWTKKDIVDENGEVITSSGWVEECTVTVVPKNTENIPATGLLEQNVINKDGFTLPSTGGMGTFLFTFVGVAMMAAAVILFFTSKKKEAK